ncbi:MAG: hypothetical protein HY888_07100 [Deltaproteobacteria bacterium]|nr:hypothetical protein [Deltaproteobacteria bacterium]
MQTLMLGLKSVPGVMGSMLSDVRGNVLASSFPAFFDQSVLASVAVLINDNSLGMQEATGEVRLFDIRTELGRVIIKVMPHLFLTVLCETTVNVQLLMISLNVAVKKLEKMPVEQLAALVQKTAVPAPKPALPASKQPVQQSAASVGTVRTTDKGIILTTKILDRTSNMSANSVIGPQSATALSNFFHGLEYKNLHLYNLKNGKSVKAPVTILSNDPAGTYDGIIGITPSIAGDLSAKDGDDLVAVVITKKGFFD